MNRFHRILMISTQEFSVDLGNQKIMLYLNQYCSTSIYVICFSSWKMLTCKFAVHNTPYTSVNNVTGLIKYLEDSARSICKWFENNQLQGNATKNHILLSRREGYYKSWLSWNQKQSIWKAIKSHYWRSTKFWEHICNVSSKTKAKLGVVSWG